MSAAHQPAFRGLSDGQTFHRSPRRGVRSLRCSLRGWDPHLEPQSTGLGTRRGRRRPSRQDLYRGPRPANCGDLRKTPVSDQIRDPRASSLRPAERNVHTSGMGTNPVQVFVRDNDGALRVLKKKMQREGTFREMKRRRSYEKPSERRVREKAEAVRRYRKAMRKRLEREGY